MKLSEALVLKAEWYLNTSKVEDSELSILLNDHEFVEDKSKPDMFWETYAHIKTNWKQWFGASNDVISYLCLLESELQKDEEALKDIQERLIEQNRLMNKIIFS